MKVLIAGGAGEVGKHLTETHPCLLGEARTPLHALGKFMAEELCKFYSRFGKIHIGLRVLSELAS